MLSHQLFTGFNPVVVDALQIARIGVIKLGLIAILLDDLTLLRNLWQYFIQCPLADAPFQGLTAKLKQPALKCCLVVSLGNFLGESVRGQQAGGCHADGKGNSFK